MKHIHQIAIKYLTTQHKHYVVDPHPQIKI